MLRRVLPFVLVLAPLTGCIVIEVPGDLSFDSEAELDGDWGEPWDDEGSLAGRGRVRGDLGAVRGFDGRTNELQGSADAYWSSVTVTAYDADGRMGMIIVDIEGADVRTLPSGTYRYSAAGVDGPGEVSGVYVTGCSSSADDSYDAPSEEGVIIVDNDGDDCTVDVEADLPSDDASVTTTATATFTID